MLIASRRIADEMGDDDDAQERGGCDDKTSGVRAGAL